MHYRDNPRANPYACCCGHTVECVPCAGTGSMRSGVCLRCEGDGVCEAVCYVHDGRPRANPKQKRPPPLVSVEEYGARRAGPLQGVLPSRPLSRDDIRLPKPSRPPQSEPVIKRRTFGPVRKKQRSHEAYIVLPGEYAAPDPDVVEGAHRLATMGDAEVVLKRLPDGVYTVAHLYDGQVLALYHVTKANRVVSRWTKV